VASRTRKIKYKASSKETTGAPAESVILLLIRMEAALARVGVVVKETSVVAAVTTDMVLDHHCRRDDISSSGGDSFDNGPFWISDIGSMVVVVEVVKRETVKVGVVNAATNGTKEKEDDEATAKNKPMERPTAFLTNRSMLILCFVFWVGF
jgi:hypothetical protein